MNNKTHASWLIAVAGVGVLAGVILSRVLFSDNTFSEAWLVTAAPLLLVAMIKKYKWMLSLAFLSGFILGVWRGGNYLYELGMYDQYIDSYITLDAKVSNDPSQDTKGRVSFHAGDIKVEGSTLSGEVWVKLDQYQSGVDILKRGDIVTVQGYMRDGFGVFSGSMSRAEVLSWSSSDLGDIGRSARDWFTAQVQKILPEDQAALGTSFVTGQRQVLSDEANTQLRMVGLVHLVVASGFHLSLVARYIRRPLSKKSKFLAAACTFLAIAGFLLVTGFSTSMIRASLVTGLSLLAWYYGRNIHPLVLLIFVAALTVLINPMFIWADVAWYLSFAAFAAVIILAPLIQSYFWGKEKQPGYLRELLVVTIAAQIATFPIVAYYFGQVSIISVLSNLMIQPLVPFVMLFVSLAGMTFPFVPIISSVVAFPARLALGYMNKAIDVLSSLPWAAREVEISSLGLTVFYFFLTVLIIILWQKTGHNFNSEDVV